MRSNVINFPRARVTHNGSNWTVEQCNRLEQGAIQAGEWEQAAFFMHAARVIAREQAQADESRLNVIPLRMA